MKAFILTLVLALASTTAMAEGKGGPHGGGKKHMARMQQELGLTDEQVAEMRQIRQSGGSKEEVQAVLTEEQQANAKELRSERKANRGDRIARMQQHLGLSDEQVKSKFRSRRLEPQCPWYIKAQYLSENQNYLQGVRYLQIQVIARL